MTVSFKMGTIGAMELKQKPKRNLIFTMTYHGEVSIPIADFLKQESPISGRSLRQYFFKGLVLLNHKKAHSQANLKDGDLIQVYGVPEEYQPLKPEPSISFDIVYEDDNLLVINKPPQLAVHPSGNITSGTLANGVAAYFEKRGLKIKVRPVNRLDYGTSGLIIFAKNAAAQTALTQAIQNHCVKRIYYAVVQGIPETPSGTIDLPIVGSPGHRQVGNSGQPALTHYQVIERYPAAALLELDIETGRTHQIRIHLSHIGHPILGDRQYGVSSPLIDRPALHAGKLTFDASGWDIPELEAPFPEDYRRLLEKMRVK